MPNFRVDFTIKGDLVLPSHTPELKIADDAVTLVLRNGDQHDGDGNPVSLIASIIAPHTDIKLALDDFRDLLTERLDWITFVTQQRFEVLATIGAMAWEPGPGRREYLATSSYDIRWPPAPDLTYAVAASAQHLVSAKHLPDYIAVAVRTFRVGVRGRTAYEQFPLFWSALETVVEATKSKEKEAMRCQSCKAELTCPACGAVQARTPMAARAIQRRILEVVGKETGTELNSALSYARNRLIHGGSLLETEAVLREKHGATLAQCVDALAFVAHKTILEAMLPHFAPDVQITIWNVDNYALGSVRQVIRGEISHDGPGDHPSNFPDIKIELKTTFTGRDGPPRPGA